MQRYPDRFVGNFIYNPRFGPENGAAELAFHVKEYGYKMMKLHANMHSYRPDRALDWLRPALRVCDELGVGAEHQRRPARMAPPCRSMIRRTVASP